MGETTKSATYTAVGLVVVGFVVIAYAWYGAARLDHPQGQIPYLISGGLSGLALIGAGLTLVRVLESRRDQLRLEAKLDALLEAVRGGAPAGDAAEIVPLVRAAAAVPADETGPIGVIAGRTAYHDPSCRLVEGREGLPVVTVAGAAERGLSPCRVCGPAALPA